VHRPSSSVRPPSARGADPRVPRGARARCVRTLCARVVRVLRARGGGRRHEWPRGRRRRWRWWRGWWGWRRVVQRAAARVGWGRPEGARVCACVRHSPRTHTPEATPALTPSEPNRSQIGSPAVGPMFASHPSVSTHPHTPPGAAVVAARCAHVVVGGAGARGGGGSRRGGRWGYQTGRRHSRWGRGREHEQKLGGTAQPAAARDAPPAQGQQHVRERRRGGGRRIRGRV
jgi:hypothetical protein